VASSKQAEMAAPFTRPGNGSWAFEGQRNTAVVDLAVVRCEFPDITICAKADEGDIGFRVKLPLGSRTRTALQVWHAI
jgi:hypothetical protein